MTDGFEVDLASVDRFRSATLGDLRSRVDAMRARLSGTAVPSHTYTSTEAGQVGLDGHRTVVDRFDERLGLALQQLDTLDERLRRTTEEYAEQDRSGADRSTSAGHGIEGVV
jgi:hypothetical protein